MSLSEEQKRRMEENRLKALKLRAEKSLSPQKPPLPRQIGAQINMQQPNDKPSPSSAINVPQTSQHSSQTRPSWIGVPVSSRKPNPWQNRFSSPKKVTTGSCVLISPTRFKVQISFHKELIDIFKSMPTRVYDANEKSWNFLLNDYSSLMEKVASLRPQVLIGTLPPTVINTFQSASKNVDNIDVDLSRLDPRLVSSLMPFQEVGVRFGIGKNGRVLIADDMGLGKTIQAIAIAAYYQNEWPLIVVAPSSMRYSWAEAFRRWLPNLDPQKILVVDTGKDELYDNKVYIVSYDLLTKRNAEFCRRNFKVAILDESHFLKSHNTVRTKAALAIFKNTLRLILLSGTPALSRPAELFSQLHLLKPSVFKNIFEFWVRYCDGKKGKFGWEFSGATRTEELLLLMENTVMIRRLKSEVMEQLPSKQRQMVVLDPKSVNSNTKEMKFYSEKMFKDSLTGLQRRGTLLTYFAETGRVKIKAVCDYLSDVLDEDRKFICFAHHVVMLDGICEMLNNKKVEYIRIDGHTKPELRKQYCDKFQHNESVRVAVLSITAANTGLTLTAAHLVIFGELFWNPGVLTQAEDRAHRIGQEDCVTIRYLVAQKTADDYLWELVQRKLDVLNKVGLSKDCFSDASTTVQKNAQTSVLDFLDWIDIDDNVMTRTAAEDEVVVINEDEPKKKTGKYN